MGQWLELRCWLIACFIFYVLVLACTHQCKGNDLSPSSQVTAAAPHIETQVLGPVSHENSLRTITPSQLLSEHGGSSASSPCIGHPPMSPVLAGDISPSSSISSPPFPHDTKNGDTNGKSPSVTIPTSSPPMMIPLESPVATPGIIAPPPSSIGITHTSPAIPPFLSVSPVNHGENNHAQPAAPSKETSHELSPAHDSSLQGFIPSSSPKTHKSVIFPSVAPAPIISHFPPKGQPPSSSLIHSKNKGTSSWNTSFPSTHQAPVISPLASPKAVGRNHNRHHAPLPIGWVPSSMQSPNPWATVKVAPSPAPFHATPSSQSHGPIVSPTPLVDNNSFQMDTPSPSPFGSSPVAPSNQNQSSVHSPVVSPSGSPHMGVGNSLAPSAKALAPSSVPVPRHKQGLPPSLAPVAQPKRALPSPPPVFDCTTFTCMDPLTNSPPGSSCSCVRPMKVELRLGVALYTFLPLVSELAKQIASGTSLNQSQVRIMGANAATDQPQKTVVLVDLVPLGKVFDKTTALLTAEKFWHKQVGIKVSSFGDYDVLYVIYPGLPPSPPLPPGNINANDAAENNSRRIHPLGVDVRKRRAKLGGSLIAIIVISSVIAFLLSIGAAWFLFLKHNGGAHMARHASQNSLPLFSKASGIGPKVLGSHPSSASGSFTSSIATYTGSAKTFTAAEIEKATNNFEDSNIIGEGGFGRVYQGILEDETKVAVKVLKRDDQQGSREFLAEVEMLSRLHHRNLVKLIGICTEEHLRCLIYELIPNGSVDSHLHGSDKEVAPLDWGTRLKIALGSARGLAYLHEDSSPRVIHRDFKSSNILLECDFTPKVSDFGLARTALDEGNGHISTRVMGTFGYVAPEYAMTGHLLVKSDVYSYGVVLLELLTGRKPVDMLRPPGQENLVTWARPLLTSREGLHVIIDPALGSFVPFDSVAKVAAIASMCVQPEVSNRPFMGEVVQALKLVSNESDEHTTLGGCSQGDAFDQDPELRTGTSSVSGSDRVLSASEIFRTSGTLTREGSGSFRMHSSSGPLKANRSGQFWQKLRRLSGGSVSEYRFALGSRTS